MLGLKQSKVSLLVEQKKISTVVECCQLKWIYWESLIVLSTLFIVAEYVAHAAPAEIFSLYIDVRSDKHPIAQFPLLEDVNIGFQSSCLFVLCFWGFYNFRHFSLAFQYCNISF